MIVPGIVQKWITVTLVFSASFSVTTGDNSPTNAQSGQDDQRSEMEHHQLMDPGHGVDPGLGSDPEMPEMPEMGMKMYFHAGTHETVLFKKWMVMSWQEMLGCCIGLWVVAVVYEGFRAARLALTNRADPHLKPKPKSESFQMGYNAYGSFNHGEPVHQNSSDSTYLDIGDHEDLKKCCPKECSMCSGWHWLETFFYVVQVFLGYCLMLTFMTYNVYICLAVLVGVGTGHLLFGWIHHKMADISGDTHCH